MDLLLAFVQRFACIFLFFLAVVVWVFEKSFTFVRLFVSKPAFEQEHALVVAPIPIHGIAGVACTFLVFCSTSCQHTSAFRIARRLWMGTSPLESSTLIYFPIRRSITTLYNILYTSALRCGIMYA